jgi:hypothetical protein
LLKTRNDCVRSNGVFRGAKESLDSQVLLDPFEEELDTHTPCVLVEPTDGGGREREVVCPNVSPRCGVAKAFLRARSVQVEVYPACSMYRWHSAGVTRLSTVPMGPSGGLDCSRVLFARA